MRNWKLFIGIFCVLAVYSVGINLYADSWPTFSNSGSGDWSAGYYRTITITNSAGVQIDYQVAITPFTDASFIDNTGLVGSWHFSEGTGTATADMSGNGNNGTYKGSSLSFDGSDDYVSIGTPASLNFNGLSAFTEMAWIKTSNINNQEIIGRHGDGTDAQGTLLTYGGGYLCVYINTTTGFYGASSDKKIPSAL